MILLRYLLLLLLTGYFFTHTVVASPVNWKIKSNKPLGTILSDAEFKFSENVKQLSKSQFTIDIIPPNKGIPIRSAFNATRTQLIDGMFMSPIYWGNADPVFDLLGGLVAAWDSPNEYYDWLENDNGIQYLKNIYRVFNLEMVGYTLLPVESLVSNHPIRNINDIAGKRIRTPSGMITDYFENLGALPREITFHKTKQALEKNRVNIADFSDVINNYLFGIYDKSKHTNYPGFHSIPLIDFVVNKKSWHKLSKEHINVLNVALMMWQEEIDNRYHSLLLDTLKNMRQEGINIYAWSTEERIKARQIAVPLWKKHARNNEDATAILQEILNKLTDIGNL